MSKHISSELSSIEHFHQESPEGIHIQNLSQFFTDTFKCEPDFFTLVPGRVNLIGEHVDYCGYSVCPMAIKNSIILAVKTFPSDVIKIVNIDPNYGHSYKNNADQLRIEVKPGKAPAWYCYVLCGIKGVLEALPSGQKPVGLSLAVTGNVPQASGLSSSSALVCAAALATVYANKLDISRKSLANLCAKAEQYIGTQGGGMDQAIALLATTGSAKHIYFNPLRSEDVQLPDGCVFVIANSLSELNKAETHHYNTRVAECCLANQVMAKFRNVVGIDVNRFSELQEKLGVGLSEMIELAKQALHEKPYMKQEICTVLGLTESELNTKFVPQNIWQTNEFKLRDRALHVLQEAQRVDIFCGICREQMPAEKALKQLGKLMSKSHESLKTLYECSHPELDRLVALSDGIALGCRLTGAGWGGCVVALTTKDTVDSYIKMLKERFYETNPTIKGKDLNMFVFATEPSGGAQIIVKHI
uniref:(California timema) hypothetical protein n=1 Tax=Timema californicum TaxID=61474 RepID=A0A7R9P5I4_TIMCA|nr:unnamed protein product [Timema californicum]